MHKIVTLFVFLAVTYTLAAPASPAAVARRRLLPALHHDEVRDDFGQYALRYITAEGMFISERGRLIPTPDGRDHVMAVEGEMSYFGEDGKKYSKKYTAGLDGYNVEGDYLPLAV
ncbi:hypothetical protein ACJJTC_008824 [Scirpophaga incertulas]